MRKQELQLVDKLGEDSNVKAVEEVRKNTIMKISRSQIKQADRFTCLGSVAEKNGQIQDEINERIRKASQFYHLTQIILRNKDTESVRP
jgi:hypothetical protein